MAEMNKVLESPLKYRDGKKVYTFIYENYGIYIFLIYNPG